MGWIRTLNGHLRDEALESICRGRISQENWFIFDLAGDYYYGCYINVDRGWFLEPDLAGNELGFAADADGSALSAGEWEAGRDTGSGIGSGSGVSSDSGVGLGSDSGSGSGSDCATEPASIANQHARILRECCEKVKRAVEICELSRE